MCANCGAMSSQFDKIDPDMTFNGSKDNRVVANIGDEIEIEIKFGEYEYMTDIRIDPTTPLPEGLTFENNKIKGTVNKPVNKFIRILFTDDLDVVHGNSLDLTVLAVAQKGVSAKVEKKGCSMSVVAASALVSLLALGGSALLLSKRRKREE